MKTTIRGDRAVLMALLELASPAWAQDDKDKAKPAPAEQGPVTRKIRGVVVDATAKPVPKAVVSRLWYTGKDRKFTPYEPVQTAADGSFTIELTSSMAVPMRFATLDFTPGMRWAGACRPRQYQRAGHDQGWPARSFAAHYESKQLGKPVGSTNTILFAMLVRANFTDFQSDEGRFDFWLPPGTYQIQGYGSSDVAQHKREVTLLASKPDVDLGAIDLAASNIATSRAKLPRPCSPPTHAG